MHRPTTPFAHRWLELDHARRFSITAFVSVALCAVFLGWLLNRTALRVVQEHDQAQMANFVRHVIYTEFEDLFTQRREALGADFGDRVLYALALDEVFRIKIYDHQGVIIWSDESALIGLRFPNEYLDRALAGEVAAVIEEPEREEHVFERGTFDRIMETYIPIRRQGRVAGVVEIYRNPASLLSQMRTARIVLWSAAVAGGIAVYLAMVGVVRRINRRQRQLEQGLRESAEELASEKSKLERIVSAVGAGLLLVGADGRVEWANERARAWLGGDRDVGGADELATLCIDGEPCARCPFGGPPAGTEFPIVCEHQRKAHGADKRVFQCITTPEPTGGEEGAPRHFLQLILDVTESKEVEAQLRHADKMSLVGQLAAGVAHEINNPVGILLTTITHHLGRHGTVGASSPLEGDLLTMERQCRRIDQSVRSLLSFSRMPEGVRVPVDLRAVLAEAIELTKPRMQHAEIDLETRCAERPCVATGDPNDLLQVALNLINNAIDAMPDGGALEIRLWPGTEDDAATVSFSVADTGVGLPAGDLVRVFEPFFTTKEIGSGTGLGLAVSKRIVESHGGTIRAANAAGGGAVFEVRLPASEATDAA